MTDSIQQLRKLIAYYEDVLVNHVCDNEYCFTQIGLMSKKWIHNIIADCNLQLTTEK